MKHAVKILQITKGISTSAVQRQWLDATHRPLTKETVVPARILNLGQGGKHEYKGGCGSAVLGKLRPSRYGTTINSWLTLLPPARWAGFKAGTPF